MICILACDSVSFPSLPQFPPLLVVLCLDKFKCLQQYALEEWEAGSGPTAQAVHSEILKIPEEAVQHPSLAWPPKSSLEVHGHCSV